MLSRAIRRVVLATAAAGGVLCVSFPSGPADGEALGSSNQKTVAGGCVRPTGPGGPHSAFFGVEATAKPHVTDAAIIAITPKNETHRWCALSFVIDDATLPQTVHVSFVKKATNKDLTLVKNYLKSSGLFSRVWVLSKRIWIATRPGT